MKNSDKMYVSAVVVAAGRGTRMNRDINKQYIEILGKPMLARTLEVFENCSAINELIVVSNTDEIIYCKQNIIDRYEFNKVKAIVAGGVTRQQSVYNGLREVSPDTAIVAIHDGARPFADDECIIASIEAAAEYGASGVAVPVKDTIKVVDSEGFVVDTPNRSNLWAIQTPQTFKYPLVMEAHRKALENNFSATDDAMLVERMGVKLKIVQGSYINIKITTPEDIAMAEAILESRFGLF